MSDLLPGDVVLLAPEGWAVVVPPVDRFYRVAEDLARGDVFAAIEAKTAPASHALTFVKRVNGKLLFLDHTHQGSRILDLESFEKQYSGRKLYVARPETVPDGRALWEAAREAALKSTSADFGVLPGQIVCSERAAVAVAKSTGLNLRGNRLGPIDVTPADFFDQQNIGKYFVVSPLEH
jgi:hypothetical protein